MWAGRTCICVCVCIGGQRARVCVCEFLSSCTSTLIFERNVICCAPLYTYIQSSALSVLCVSVATLSGWLAGWLVGWLVGGCGSWLLACPSVFSAHQHRTSHSVNVH